MMSLTLWVLLTSTGTMVVMMVVVLMMVMIPE